MAQRTSSNASPQWWLLILALVTTHSAGIIGSILTTPSLPGWYASLVKPDFTPPNWVFGPVWLILYTLMGIALYLVWRDGVSSLSARMLSGLFFLQVFINALWSAVFFGAQNPLMGFAVIVGVWILALAIMVRLLTFNRVAAYLHLPYLLWVSFAMLLNLAIWQLNS